MKNKKKTSKKGKKGSKETSAQQPLSFQPLQPAPESSLAKYDPLQRYMWEIGRYELLTSEEEKELALRVREYGDTNAAYRLITANLRLVVKIAMEFQRVWMQNLLDLIQEGNIGLIHAVRKFDPYKGVRFSYYASFWIKAYILKFIMENWRLVKIGTTQAQRKLFFRLKKEKQKLISEGFEPAPRLLSERLGVTEQEITKMDERLDAWEESLDAPVKEGSNTERIAFMPTSQVSAETQVARKEIEAIIHEKLASFKARLNERELDILENRILSDTPATLREIGERYGISRERVRQIENAMIAKMKAYFKSKIPDFDSFVGGVSEK
ncbi:MAG: RNA polymerase factor sigma-32 [Deltaproteobacteria bacterium]|nr:RNA polymerase factor sigma-32 [Deltaproteobacteria bacterium]RLB91168.1 MAG: RNA polymerase subunit sigma-70 [Deltaproteobacteria bacterium]RLB96349.1 MAG: RNA polymerase subunit sigma-70 [Deltaproteobacteria bacterium]